MRTATGSSPKAWKQTMVVKTPRHYYRAVVQLGLEHRTVTPEVAGSSPASVARGYILLLLTAPQIREIKQGRKFALHHSLLERSATYRSVDKLLKSRAHDALSES